MTNHPLVIVYCLIRLELYQHHYQQHLLPEHTVNQQLCYQLEDNYLSFGIFSWRTLDPLLAQQFLQNGV